MDSLEILNRITAVVQDVLGLDELALTPQTEPQDVERWDSVSNINIIMTLEQEFGIRFALGELESMLTVDDIINGVTRHLNT